MTLILGMSKPEGIYLSVDYRVTEANTRKLIDDASTKSLTIHYPPLDGSGPRVLLGFSGLAKLGDGTPTLDWIRETIRGESEFIDQSMSHLLARLNRDIAHLRVPLIINLLVLEKNRRLFGGLSNLRWVSPTQTAVMDQFGYEMSELNEWWIFASGSGASRIVTDGHFDRLRPHLGVVPRKPMNHMNLLAVINLKVAARDATVSPFCHVSFINADERFGPVSHRFTERAESAPFDVAVVLSGIDLTDRMRQFHKYAEALFKGEIQELPEMGPEEIDKAIKRRD